MLVLQSAIASRDYESGRGRTRVFFLILLPSLKAVGLIVFEISLKILFLCCILLDPVLNSLPTNDGICRHVRN